MDLAQIKRVLVEKCTERLMDRIALLEKARKGAQADANEHLGRIESRYDTFKEEAQFLSAGYQRQLFDSKDQIRLMADISTAAISEIQLGAVVETSDGTYFMVPNNGDGEICIDNRSYLPIAPNSPLGRALIGKQAGDLVRFRDKVINLVRVF